MFIVRKSQYCQDVNSSQIYRLNTISLKILASYFVDINKVTLKFICRGKRPRIANSVMKKNTVGRLILPAFKTYKKATIIKIVWY